MTINVIRPYLWQRGNGGIKEHKPQKNDAPLTEYVWIEYNIRRVGVIAFVREGVARALDREPAQIGLVIHSRL